MRFPALQSRNFCLYEGGSLFSQNGQWITRIIVGWLAWELTGSATWVGLLSFFLFAPVIVTSPVFGVLTDRIRLRPAAILSHGIVTAGTFLLFVLYITDALTIWSLSAVALVIGVAGSGERTVRMAILPRMVEFDALPNAVSIHATNFNVARLLGPAIGGVLIERFGTGTAILVNLLVLIPFLIAMLFLRIREKDASRTPRPPFLEEFMAGARHTNRHPVIREALVLTCITSLTVRGVLEILPTLADGVFHRGPEGLGQMVAAGGAGALIGALINAVRFTRSWGKRIPILAHFAVFLGLIAVAGLGFANNWTLAMLFVAVCGFSGTTIGINMQATIQLTVDDDFRGRVMSLWMVTGIGASAVGALVLGIFSDVFGLSQTLISCGLAGVVLVFVIRIMNFRNSAHASLRSDSGAQSES